MKNLTHNAVDRSILQVGFRLSQKMDNKRHYNDAFELCETEQQYQLDLTGIAGGGAWVQYTLNFQEIIYYAPLQRNNKLEDPQISHSSQFDQGRCMIEVHVTRWLLDDSANYTGAVVEVGFHQTPYDATQEPTGTPFKATIHITFQGLSAPVEDPGYDETP